ncbi:MAG: hypothetical protein J6C62_03285 [Clostridia bacterium]|nr:hypothetical protein [Clostridia bacterium]
MSEEKFEYTYSTLTEAERFEAEHIRNKYLKKEVKSDKLSRLRKLDGKVKNIPTCIGLILGVIGTLIFGLGFTMILEWSLILWGVLVSAVGLLVASTAYFLYEKSSTYLREKYSQEILQLSGELLGEENQD